MATARLQWTLSADDGQGDDDVRDYQIARSNSPNATTIITTDDEVPAGTSMYDDTVGTGTWYWRVRARDTSGNISGWSNEVSQIVDLDPPAAPTGLTVTIL
jgi:hypothetical protein